MTDEQQVAAGKRVEAFLADEAVKNALIELEKRYFADFKRAKTAEERETLHARVRALEDLFETVLGIKESGKLAQHTIEQREKTEARQRKSAR